VYRQQLAPYISPSDQEKIQREFYRNTLNEEIQGVKQPLKEQKMQEYEEFLEGKGNENQYQQAVKEHLGACRH
jgi:hypothetical protein